VSDLRPGQRRSIVIPLRFRGLEAKIGCSSSLRSGYVVAAVLIAATWVAIGMRFTETEPEEPPARSALWKWDALGCFRVAADPFPEDAGVEALPEYLMLVADSLDQWGREYETYRAVPLDSDAVLSTYRWFTRADTLWVVWSDKRSQGGLALREGLDGFLGRARVTGTSIDVSARVRAWRMNCATRQIESPGRLRR